MKEGIALDVRSLGVAFGTRHVLRDLSFTIDRGHSVALIGPNGSGKTVLFRALLGFLPHTGSVRWADDTRIGYVPQSLSIEPDLPLTVAEFFACKGTHRADVVNLLQRVGLGGDHADPEHARGHIRDHVMRSRMGELSGGQLQRTLIAWALAGNPTVLLFDEPTSGIDVSGQESVYALLSQLRRERGMTLLLISHDLDVVYAHADHVLCISSTLVCHGPPRLALDPTTLKKLYGGAVGFPAHTDLHRHDH